MHHVNAAALGPDRAAEPGSLAVPRIALGALLRRYLTEQGLVREGGGPENRRFSENVMSAPKISKRVGL